MRKAAESDRRGSSGCVVVDAANAGNLIRVVRERIGGEGSECADCDKRGACPWRGVRGGVVNGDLEGSENAELRQRASSLSL